MKQRSQMRLLLACLAVLCFASFATAQLPNLGQITGQVTQTDTGEDDSTSATATATQTNTRAGNTQQTQTTATNTRNTQATTGTTTNRGQTTTSARATTDSAATNLFPSNVVTSSNLAPGTNFNRLSGAPTLQGVGIPTMIVPYTASAPFMQKSSLPEGTVFIAVGAVLAFLGFCVIAWRGLVAWSINRSVKRAALASIMASDTKNPGGWASNPFKPAGGFYHQAPGGSTLDLNERNDKHSARTRSTAVPPANTSGLFFSPTASNTASSNNIPMANLSSVGNRSSSFLPAGYYASPSSQLGSGNSQATIGGNGQGSPSLQARRMSNNRLSNMQLAPPSREGGANRLSSARPASNISLGGAYGGQGHLHPQASASSLQVGTGHGEDLPGSRAPSAYLEDLFESHGNPAQNAGPHR